MAIVWTNWSGKSRHEFDNDGETYYRLSSQDGRSRLELGGGGVNPDILWATDPADCVEWAVGALRRELEGKAEWWRTQARYDLGSLEKGLGILAATGTLSLDVEYFLPEDRPRGFDCEKYLKDKITYYRARLAEDKFGEWNPAAVTARESLDCDHRPGVPRRLAEALWVVGLLPEGRRKPINRAHFPELTDDEIDPYTGLVPVYIVLRRGSGPQRTYVGGAKRVTRPRIELDPAKLAANPELGQARVIVERSLPPDQWGRLSYPNEADRIAAWRSRDLSGQSLSPEKLAARLAEIADAEALLASA